MPRSLMFLVFLFIFFFCFVLQNGCLFWVKKCPTGMQEFQSAIPRIKEQGNNNYLENK